MPCSSCCERWWSTVAELMSCTQCTGSWTVFADFICKSWIECRSIRQMFRRFFFFFPENISGGEIDALDVLVYVYYFSLEWKVLFLIAISIVFVWCNCMTYRGFLDCLNLSDSYAYLPLRMIIFTKIRGSQCFSNKAIMYYYKGFWPLWLLALWVFAPWSSLWCWFFLDVFI